MTPSNTLHALPPSTSMMPPPSYADQVTPSTNSQPVERIVDAKDSRIDDLQNSLDDQTLNDHDNNGIQRADTGKVIEQTLEKGCPTLLIPINSDWSPTMRDLEAPQVLPKRSMGGRFRLIFSRSAGKPLKPLPASFERSPPPATHGQSLTTMSTSINPDAPTYSTFETFYLPSRHKTRVTEGFESRYPAAIMVDHNVSAVDWDRFLVNIMVAAALRGYEHLIANLAPSPLIVLHAGYGNYWITQGILGAFRKRHIPEVLALIETYQHRFFGPRGLDVFVAVGTKRISGHYPGDTSYLQAPEIELGVPLKKTKRVAKGKVMNDLKRLPKDERKMIKKERKSENKLKKLENKAAGLPKKQHIHEQHAELFAKRAGAIQEEREQGFEMKKEGRYRIIVQPLNGPPPQPPSDWIRKMEKMEAGWGKKKAPAPAGMIAGQDI